MSFELPPLSTEPQPSAPSAPEQPARRPFRSWPLAAQMAVGCGSGCAVLALGQVLFVWAVLSIGVHTRPPDGLEVDADYPKQVRAGVKFPLTLTVRNHGSESFTVQNIIGRAELLEKLTLSNPRPVPKQEANVMGQATWSYMQKVPPGDYWKLQFDAKATQPGSISEKMDVQVNMAPNPIRIRLTATK